MRHLSCSGESSLGSLDLFCLLFPARPKTPMQMSCQPQIRHGVLPSYHIGPSQMIADYTGPPSITWDYGRYGRCPMLSNNKQPVDGWMWSGLDISSKAWRTCCTTDEYSE